MPWSNIMRMPASVLVGLLVLGARAPAVPVDPGATKVLVHQDGSLSLLPGSSGSASADPAEPSRCRLRFGLPSGSPAGQRLEHDRLPIARTQWETNGIRYTQVVLMTRSEAGDVMPEGKLPDDAVLIVQIAGENTASEYREATASLVLEMEGNPREIELRDDQVFEPGSAVAPLLAVVEIPATGVSVARGRLLRFRGSMPPGTSGSMTVKIPMRPSRGEAALERLRGLDFDEEFRRVKRFWTDHLNAQTFGSLPLALAPEAPTPVGATP